jgi:superfamily II DNA or RNA helicase
MTTLRPRKYQVEAIDAVKDAWDSGLMRPAVVLPTGAGKTVVFANMIAGLLTEEAIDKAVILVHRDELAKQAADKVRSIAPDLNVGIVKAEQNDVDSQVVVASVQTLYRQNRVDQLLEAGKPGLVVYDECHHAVAPANMSVLEQLGAFDSTRCVGFTATMSRADSYGLGDVWEDVVYKKDILWGIINGFLVDVRGESITVDDLNLAQVAKSRGDYQEGKLGDALINSGAGKVVAENYKAKAGDRQGIVFTPSVACAEDFLSWFNDEGIASELIVGTTPVEERSEIYDRYRDGKTQVLVSVMALTEGFDMPQAEVAVIARPTMSSSLYIQMVGRVLRPFPGKTEALLLDVVGATDNVSLSGVVDLSETHVAPEKGESLAEAYDRIQRESNNLERDVVSGKVTSQVVELFRASSSVWLRTEGGYWFIPTREGYIFLWPYQNGFKVGITGSQYKMKGGRYLKDEPLDLPFAMAWGEQFAEEIDPEVTQRSASWRKKKSKPSEKQRQLADRLGIRYDGSTTKDDLSNRVSKHFASKILDSIKRS